MVSDFQCSFKALGRTANPWADMQGFLHEQMYPNFTRGFTARVAVLLALLAFVILISLAYLFVTVRDVRRKRREIWLARVVLRPEGRYLALNQYLIYPLLSIVLAAVWIAYVAYIYQMLGPTQGNPRALFYWLTLGWLPFFALLSITTFSTTSAANLASRGRKPHTHRLSPAASAAMCIVLLPVLLGLVLGVGIWTGTRWYRFASNWQNAYDFLGRQARRYDGTLDAAAVTRADALLLARCQSSMVAKDALLTNTIIYVVAAGVLIFLNLFSGIYLLATLRQIDDRHLVVPRGTRLVAPLEPLPASTTAGEQVTLADVRTAGQPAAWEADADAEVSKMKVRRLQWDVTLFFMSVVPSCLAFIGYTAWLGTQFVDVLFSPARYEFATLGMIWIYAAVSLTCLAALTIKTVLSLRAAARHPLVDAVGPSMADAQLRRRVERAQRSGVSGDDVDELDDSDGDGVDQRELWRRSDLARDEDKSQIGAQV
ncbi:hypothetical protein JCM3770_001422 [Rhodotorula araucariae]